MIRADTLVKAMMHPLSALAGALVPRLDHTGQA